MRLEHDDKTVLVGTPRAMGRRPQLPVSGDGIFSDRWRPSSAPEQQGLRAQAAFRGHHGQPQTGLPMDAPCIDRLLLVAFPTERHGPSKPCRARGDPAAFVGITGSSFVVDSSALPAGAARIPERTPNNTTMTRRLSGTSARWSSHAARHRPQPVRGSPFGPSARQIPIIVDTDVTTVL